MSQGFLLRDYDTADLVFEGSLKALDVTQYIEKDDIAFCSKNSVLNFNVEKVVRGSHNKADIAVIWENRFCKNSIARFNREYGEKVRVGVIKPESLTDRCRREQNAELSDIEAYRNVVLRCRKRYTSINAEDAAKEVELNLPFVLKKTCSETYILPIESERDKPETWFAKLLRRFSF